MKVPPTSCRCPLSQLVLFVKAAQLYGIIKNEKAIPRKAKKEAPEPRLMSERYFHNERLDQGMGESKPSHQFKQS